MWGGCLLLPLLSLSSSWLLGVMAVATAIVVTVVMAWHRQWWAVDNLTGYLPVIVLMLLVVVDSGPPVW